MLVSDRHEIKSLADRMRDYLQSVLHVRLLLKAWDETASLPLLFSKRFGFWLGDIQSMPCLFVVTPPDDNMTPAELEKRYDHLQSITDQQIVFVFDHMPSYNRARLIERAIPFVVPDNQLYIPQLAVDLREHFRGRPREADSNLSPVAQVVLFRHLLMPPHEDWTPSVLAKTLRYSSMSAGRAFEELTSHGLARIEPRGRSKYLIFETPNDDIFERARHLLRSPVISTHFFYSLPPPKGFYGSWMPGLPLGGEAALAERSMLNPPKNEHFAAGPTEWKVLQADTHNKEVEHAEEANFGVDVWRYDPDIVTGEPKADPLSLYMQFHNHADERVAGAATQLMEEFTWFRD